MKYKTRYKLCQRIQAENRSDTVKKACKIQDFTIFELNDKKVIYEYYTKLN